MSVFTDEQINEIISIFTQHMGHRQYIGARYVPIFGRVGEDTIEWDDTKPYEPLTIVLNQGNSYTSRQYVPAGIEITNEDFWANTGNYNAQIEQYRKEVQAFDERITQNTEDVGTLKTNLASEATARTEADTALGTRIDNEATARTEADTALGTRIDNEVTARTEADKKLNSNLDFANIVLIGDSYLRGVGTAPMQGWGYYFKQRLASTATITEFGNSGAGFIADGHTDPMNGMNFSEQVNYAATQVNAADVDYVIIGGGWNDNGNSYKSVFNATASCVANARAKFPNAKIVIVSLSNELHSQTAAYINANIAIVKGAQSAGADTPDLSWLWLKANNDVISSDNIHPNATGYEMQGYMIAAALRGSNATPSTHMGAGFTAGEAIKSNTARCAIVNGICYIQGEFTATNWSNSTTLGTLPPAMRPARTVYELAQFAGSSYKEIVPIYINADTGVMQPRTPFNGSYPSGEATIYLPHISFPIGIL